LELGERVQGKDHPDVAVTVRNLGALYALQGRYDKAEPYYRRAISVLEKAWGTTNPQLFPILNDFVAVLRANHSYAEAEQWEVRATRVQVVAALKGR
jgi:tetratricopeptide (TPR) repeat protein